MDDSPLAYAFAAFLAVIAVLHIADRVEAGLAARCETIVPSGD